MIKLVSYLLPVAALLAASSYAIRTILLGIALVGYGSLDVALYALIAPAFLFLPLAYVARRARAGRLHWKVQLVSLAVILASALAHLVAGAARGGWKSTRRHPPLDSCSSRNALSHRAAEC